MTNDTTRNYTMILQKQITTSKATILVISGILMDANKIRIKDNWLWVRYDGDGKKELQPFVALNPEYINSRYTWQPLGFLKDITEDMAKELVQTYFLDFNLWGFKDYTRTDASICYINATDSLRSLIEANCKLKNEYGNVRPELDPECCNKIVYDRNGFPECCGMPVPSEESVCLQQRWDKEQETVFTNPFLLKKI